MHVFPGKVKWILLDLLVTKVGFVLFNKENVRTRSQPSLFIPSFMNNRDERVNLSLHCVYLCNHSQTLGKNATKSSLNSELDKRLRAKAKC